MIRLRVFIVSAVVCSVCAAGAVAGLIENGDFESVTGGKFDSWNYLPATSGGSVAVASSAPVVLDGSHSAKILAGAAQGGRLWQSVGEGGWRDFGWSLEFAVTPADLNTRSFCILTYSDTINPSNPSANNVDSIRVWSDGNLQFFKGGGWTNVGAVNLSTDLNNPVLNSLVFTGENYGTPSQSFTMILNGGTPHTNTGFVTNGMVRFFALGGHVSSVDYLVDNVVFVPEPSSGVLLAMALVGLLGCIRRRRA